MPVVSFVSPKGGAGKTTSALLLATEFAQSGHNVTLVDADPNLPLVKWSKLPGRPANLEVIQELDEQEIIDTIEAAVDRTEFVIVDLEGSAALRVANAVSMSNLVLIPLQASGLDLDQAARSLKVIANASKTVRRPIPHAILFTRVPASQRIRSRNFKFISQSLEGRQHRVMKTALAEREAYKSLFLAGGTLATLDRSYVPSVDTAMSNASLYAQEVRALLREGGE